MLSKIEAEKVTKFLGSYGFSLSEEITEGFDEDQLLDIIEAELAEEIEEEEIDLDLFITLVMEVVETANDKF